MESQAEAQALLRGLQSDPPAVSPKWFYDAVGSALFETITRLPDYYPTRVELEILDTHLPEIARRLGPGRAVVELGSGSGAKVGRLLAAMQSPRGYAPIDVSAAALATTKAEIGGLFPDLPVRGLCGDFTDPEALTGLVGQAARRGPVVLFFPGSTIGNFAPVAAARLLRHAGMGLLEGTPFLLGVDLIKDRALLERAYDDPAGVTAAFNRNLLMHLNREFGTKFDARAWRHEAHWCPDHRRVEMWLRALAEQRVVIAGTELQFAPGDGIHTESAHKWSREAVEGLADASGWRLAGWYTDAAGWFAEALLEKAG